MRKSLIPVVCLASTSLVFLATLASAQTRLIDRMKANSAPDVSMAMKGHLPGKPLPAFPHTAASMIPSASSAPSAAARPHLGRKHLPKGLQGQSLLSSAAQLPSVQWSLPVWISSFVTQGVEYPFTMIGTNPLKGQTSVVPTVIAPYRLVFPETGDVLDASTDLVDGVTAVEGIKNSPIFQSVPFSAGPTHLGNTQYGDAMMRSSFWRIHSDLKDGYHVLLGGPAVLASQTLIVDPQYGFVFVEPSGTKVAVLDSDWVDAQVLAAMQNPSNNIDPSKLAVHLFPSLELVDSVGDTFIGYHSATGFGTGPLQTYIVAPYSSVTSTYYGSSANTEVLGHEVMEWLNDPGAYTQAPLWQDPNYGRYCWNPLLEVADPLYTFPDFVLPSKGRPYKLPQVAFLPWFSRSHISISVNGWYTSSNLFGPSLPCPNFPLDQYAVLNGDFSYLYLDFPGANTYFYAINNRNQVVGETDNGGYFQSFLANIDIAGGTVEIASYIYVPGSYATFAYGISDAGQIVGTYYDQNLVRHGFLLFNGKYTVLDFPGAKATEVNAINNPERPSEAMIVGGYVDASGIEHGLVIRGGRFITVDAPFATNVEITGINRSGQVVGFYSSDSTPGVTLGFMGDLNHLKPVTYPTNPTGFFFQGLNDRAQGVGFSTDGLAFQEINNIYSPMSFGNFTAFDGINNAETIAGSVYFNGTSDGIIFLPTASGNHGGRKAMMLVQPSNNLL